MTRGQEFSSPRRPTSVLARGSAGNQKFGDARLPPRFWAKVRETDSGCWRWTAAKDRSGYAKVKHGGRTWRAHRLAYETLVGPVPAGLELDHRICQDPGCVNPSHLDAVTHLVNIQRTDRARAQSCARGHRFTDANTYWRPKRGGRRHRVCRACRRLSPSRVPSL